MGKLILAIFGALLTASVVIGVFWVAIRGMLQRSYQRRMLRKDPKILAQQGLLNQQAAERLADMTSNLDAAMIMLQWSAATAEAILKDEQMIFLPRALVENLRAMQEGCTTRANHIRRMIDKEKTDK
jgi:hypothetical protein